MSTTTTTFEWDEQNNLSAMTLPGGSREEYVYSADGLRHQKKVNGSVTHYIWDEQNLLQEKDASLQTQVQYTTQPYGYGPILSQRRLGGASQSSAQLNKVGFGSAQFNQGNSPAVAKSTFYGTDLSGNVRNLTDSSGAVTDRYVTTVFGKPVNSTGNTINPYRFGGSVGYYQDNPQQYYVRRRYLNTNQARWISSDPIGFNGNDWNLYRYSANNPGNSIDPSGLKCICTDAKPCCGPEIGPYLGPILKAVGNYFRKLDDTSKADRCLSLIRPDQATGSWDISQLNTRIVDTSVPPGYYRAIKPFQHYKCGINSCWDTAMVDGKCHQASHVNYALFGVMWRICHDEFPLSQIHRLPSYSLSSSTERLMYEYLNMGSQLRKTDFAISTIKAAVYAWQTFNFGISLGQRYRLSGASSKVNWAYSGFNRGPYGNGKVPPETFTKCKTCNYPAEMMNPQTFGVLSARWGIEGPDGGLIP